MSIERLEKLAKDARDEFVSKRTTIESEVKTLQSNLSRLPDSLKAKLPFEIETLTAETHLPALYSNEYNEEDYKSQRAAFDEKVLSHARELRSQVEKEAEALLSAYGS